MAHSIDELLSSGALSEEVRSSISEAWEAKQTELREEVAAELREEFAERYENDKAQIVEAMDTMIGEVIAKELSEFQQDKAKVAEDRVAYRKHMKEHARVLDEFVMETLRKEIRELREDREAQEKNMTQLEGFVLEQLTKELNEFHEDKRGLVEAKVKMIKEGKAIIDQTKREFVKTAAEKVNNILESTIKKELTTLREDIQVAKENTFGRKIFETFAAEFMGSYLNEGTEVAKLGKQMNELNAKLVEAQKAVVEAEVKLTESARKIRVAEDKAERKLVMNEMMSPLSKQQREIMGALLESTKTADLKTAFSKYLPSVLNESRTTKTQEKKVLSESTKDITGNKQYVSEDTGTAEIINLRKLAGIS
jgi:hypothetical protein